MFKGENVPLDYWRFIRLGRAKKILGDFEGAIKEYTNAIITSKKLSNAFFHRGNIYSILGNHHLAIKDYKEALKKSNTFYGRSYILEKIDKQYIDKFKN